MNRAVVLECVAEYEIRREPGGYSVTRQQGQATERYQDRVLDWVTSISASQVERQGPAAETVALTDDLILQIREAPDERQPESLKVFQLQLLDLNQAQRALQRLQGWSPWIRKVFLWVVGLGIVVALTALGTWAFFIWLKTSNPQLYCRLGLATEPERVEVERIPKGLQQHLETLLNSYRESGDVLRQLADLEEYAAQAQKKGAGDTAEVHIHVFCYHYIEGKEGKMKVTQTINELYMYAGDWVKFSEFLKKARGCLEEYEKWEKERKP